MNPTLRRLRLGPSRALRISRNVVRLMQYALHFSGNHEQPADSIPAPLCNCVFFYDILVYSDSLSSYIQHLETIFQTLLQGQIYLKRAKCLFAQTQLEYLGHIVSDKGVEPEPSKIRAMVQWPTLTLAKELRAFLGLTRFYRKFIKNYASIAAPLSSLLCKDAFLWTLMSQIAFDQLKSTMTSAPVLALPNFAVSFIIETDASGTTMRVVQMQQGHPHCILQ